MAKKWQDAAIFKVDKIENKKKYYVLEMFPYPSGKNTYGTCKKLYAWRCGGAI